MIGQRRLALLVAGAALLAANRPPVVQTDAGAVRGEAVEAGAAFRGIPFAAPPVGPMRWREAQRVRPWQGTRDATRFGRDCPQLPREGGKAHPQGEDCLTLNVITPNRAAKGLPVLVSIHGGAYAFGSGRYIAEAGLSPLVRAGVILVSPNYRVGRFGFLAHPALTAEAGRGTGNFWLSDQLLALDWVKRNIARFGGDPANVTILGCSAGGSSVNSLMVAPAARGLFARASVHSGGGFFNATRPLAQAEREGAEFAARAGVAQPGAAGLAALRRLPVGAVLAADPGAPNFGAIVDGALLPEPVSQGFAAGRQAHVPLIAGSTSDEASVFGLMGFDAAVLKQRFGIDLAELRKVYGADGGTSDAQLLRKVQTDFIFTSAALGMSALAARSAPAWTYHFDYVPPAQRSGSAGAPHCADMPYLFGLDSAAEAWPGPLLRNYWLNFMRFGDPNGQGLPRWEQAIPGGQRVLLIDDVAATASTFRPAAVSFWHHRWAQANGTSILP